MKKNKQTNKQKSKNREVKAKLTSKTKQIGKNVKVRNENGKVKNKNRNLSRKAKWRSENQKVKNKNGKVKNKNEITTWPPLGFRKVKLCGNCIIVTCPFMILSFNGFDDCRIAVDYSRLNFP